MQTILAVTDLSQLGQDHIPGPSLCINDSKQGAGKIAALCFSALPT